PLEIGARLLDVSVISGSDGVSQPVFVNVFPTPPMGAALKGSVLLGELEKMPVVGLPELKVVDPVVTGKVVPVPTVPVPTAPVFPAEGPTPFSPPVLLITLPLLLSVLPVVLIVPGSAPLTVPTP